MTTFETIYSYESPHWPNLRSTWVGNNREISYKNLSHEWSYFSNSVKELHFTLRPLAKSCLIIALVIITLVAFPFMLIADLYVRAELELNSWRTGVPIAPGLMKTFNYLEPRSPDTFPLFSKEIEKGYLIYLKRARTSELEKVLRNNLPTNELRGIVLSYLTPEELDLSNISKEIQRCVQHAQDDTWLYNFMHGLEWQRYLNTENLEMFINFSKFPDIERYKRQLVSLTNHLNFNKTPSNKALVFLKEFSQVKKVSFWNKFHANILTSMPTSALKSLSFTWTGMFDFDPQTKELLKNHSDILKELTILFQPPNFTMDFVPHLRNLQKFYYSNYSDHPITNEFLQTIATHFGSLTDLYLYTPSLREPSSVHVARILQNNPMLKDLYIHFASLSPEIIKAIAENGSSLSTLSLSLLNLNDFNFVFTHLMTSNSNLRTLRHFRVNNWHRSTKFQVSFKGAKAFLEAALQCSPSLKIVTIDAHIPEIAALREMFKNVMIFCYQPTPSALPPPSSEPPDTPHP